MADIAVDVFRMFTMYVSSLCCTFYNLMKWKLLFPLLCLIDKAADHKDDLKICQIPEVVGNEPGFKPDQFTLRIYTFFVPTNKLMSSKEMESKTF